MIRGGIYFALESVVWSGGMAFYDPTLPGRVAARAYLVSVEQFCDIVEQEMHREPTRTLDLREVISTGRQRVGPGRYETLYRVGTKDGSPLLTFSAPWSADDVDFNRPSVGYLRMLADGLRQAHGWTVEEIAAYLAEVPGAAGEWSVADLHDLLGARP